MIIVAIVQQKGGSGKTTIATNLAAAAHLSGLRTLLLDTDRQGSATDWGACRAADSPLQGLEVKAAHSDRGLDLAKIETLRHVGLDCVIIDCPPRLGAITQSAAVLADLVVLPTQPGPFDFWASAETDECIDRANEIRAELGKPHVPRLVILNRAPVGALLTREGKTELAAGPDFAGVVHQRVAFPTAAARGESVLTAAATGLAAAEIRRLWRAVKATHAQHQTPQQPPRRKAAKKRSRGKNQ